MFLECDECTHYLMDDIDYLDGNITEVQSGLTTVSIGVEAMKRLDRANQTVFDLQVSTFMFIQNILDIVCIVDSVL